MSDAWFLLFTDTSLAAPARAAELIAAAGTRITRLDALHALRSESGLIPIALPRDEAEPCANALSRAGFHVLAVPRERLVHPPPARLVAAAYPTDEGLRVTPQPGAPSHLLPWRHIGAVRVARVTPGNADLRLLLPPPPYREPTTHDAAAGMHASEDHELGGLRIAGEALSWLLGLPAAELWAVAQGISAKRSPHPEPSILTADAPPPTSKVPEVWLELLGFDPLLRLRIRRNTFDYSALGAAQALSTRANFATLLRTVISHLRGVAQSGRVDEALAQGLRDDAEQDDALDQREHELVVVALLTRLALHGPAAPRAD